MIVRRTVVRASAHADRRPAFELFSGAPPFEGTGTGLMYRIVHEPPAPFGTSAAGLPPSVERTISRALRKDPAERWTTAGEFADALRLALADRFAGLADVEELRTLVPAATTLEKGSDVALVPPPARAERGTPLDAHPGTATGGAGEGRGRGRRRGLVALLSGGLVLLAAGLGAAFLPLAVAGEEEDAAADDATPTSTPTTSPSPTRTVALAPVATATPTPTATSTPPPTATATPALVPPAPPGGVTYTGSASGGTLTWADAASNETGYRVYFTYTDINTNVATVTPEKDLPANATTTEVPTKFLIGTTCCSDWGVAAFNGAGESGIVWSRD